MHHLNGVSTDDAPEPHDRGDHFASLVDALREMAGKRVQVIVCESNTGFSFASFTGTVAPIHREEDVVELRLSGEANWLKLYADSVECLTADEWGIEIEYAAGNVSITPIDE